MRIALALLLTACSASPRTSCSSDRDCGSGRCVDAVCSFFDGGRSDAGRSDAGRDAGRPSLDAPMCVIVEPDEITCNALDDDCDGYIDDVDVGHDGICDCLNVGVLGDPGVHASSSFQVWLEARGTTVVRFGLYDAALTAAALAPFDVVVLDRLRRDYSATEADVLRASVEA